MFWKLSEPKPNGPLMAHKLMKLMDIKLSATTLQDEIEAHPNYPSILSISDVLSKYNIENITASFKPDQLRNIPSPYITQLKGKRTEIDYFTVIAEVSGEGVKIFDPERQKWDWIQFEELIKRSSGIVLFAEAKADAGEQNYRQKRQEEKLTRYGMLLLTSLVLTIFAFSIEKSLARHGWTALFPVLFFLTSIVGVFLGILLVWYELDRYNPVIQQICKATKHVNCNAILQSDAAKVGGVSLSIIGMSYFTGTSLLMLIQGFTEKGTMMILGWLSLCASPFVFFSLYYQWKVARQWCMLCLLVQVVLLSQLLTSLLGGWIQNYFPYGLTLEYFFLAVTVYALPLLTLILLLPVLRTAKNAKRYSRDLNRLKFDPIVFDALLKKQKNIHNSSTGIGITIGNHNAKNKILKVCNPYCAPCAKAHTPIEELLKANPDIQLQIIFTASTEENDKKRLPVRHFLSIAANKDESALLQALSDWYLAEEKNYEPFALKYPMQEEPSVHDLNIAAMHNWCKVNDILHTPTIFINDYEIPEIYLSLIHI